nr:MAG TPA: hypothetical protein [Caudoviricetes sp.]
MRGVLLFILYSLFVKMSIGKPKFYYRPGAVKISTSSTSDSGPGLRVQKSGFKRGIKP